MSDDVAWLVLLPTLGITFILTLIAIGLGWLSAKYYGRYELTVMPA